MAEVAPVTVLILTFNEEVNLQRCLRSVDGWAEQVIVIDSFSTDSTTEIARSHDAEVIEHEYVSHASQWRWILDNAPVRNEWVLVIDADQAIEPDLRDAISRRLADASVSGYYLRHRLVFRGRTLKRGGLYPRYRLLLFKWGEVFLDDNDISEARFFVRGRADRIPYDVVEDNVKDRDFLLWLRKQVRYAELGAVEEHLRRDSSARPTRPTLFGPRNARVVFFKMAYARLPLYWRAFLYFAYRYFLRLGFLEGRAGFLYHFSQALVYRVAMDSQVDRLRRQT